MKLNIKVEDGKEKHVYIAGNIGEQGMCNDIQARLTEVEKQLVGKYAEMIITAHDDSCLWRNKGCDGGSLLWPTSQRLTDFRYHFQTPNKSPGYCNE